MANLAKTLSRVRGEFNLDVERVSSERGRFVVRYKVKSR
jgi:hypothetical protein